MTSLLFYSGLQHPQFPLQQIPIFMSSQSWQIYVNLLQRAKLGPPKLQSTSGVPHNGFALQCWICVIWSGSLNAKRRNWVNDLSKKRELFLMYIVQMGYWITCDQVLSCILKYFDEI
jgi:hypothetical protein